MKIERLDDGEEPISSYASDPFEDDRRGRPSVGSVEPIEERPGLLIRIIYRVRHWYNGTREAQSDYE